MKNLLLAALLATHGGIASTTPAIGPCDLVTCSEAWSVTRGMTRNYSGPLFQLYNGSTTLNIGQDTAHRVDMTTWSAFCSGVASNCKISAIYAQIQGSTNDLLPWNLAPQNGRAEPDCSASITTCAAVFSIEAATGLPIVNVVTGNNYVLGRTDTASVGINTNGATVSGGMNFKVQITNPQCCGQFGLGHTSPVATPGTDFILMQSYSTTGFCTVANQVCIATDLESLPGQIITALPTITTDDNGFLLMTYSGNGTNTFHLNYNGTAQGSSVASGEIQGDRMRLGGGGDRTQPAPIKFREGFFANSDLNSNAAAIFANQQAFYANLMFKLP